MRRIILSLVLLFLPLSALALNLTYPEVLKLTDDTSLTSLVASLYTFLVMISGLAAFVMIVWGGVQWMTSQGNPTATSDAKDKIKMALLGLLLVLASFLILQIINPELTALNIIGLTPVPSPPLEGATYRCELLGGIDRNFKCTGKLPIVEQGSSGPGEQCIVTQSSSNSGNCPTKCRSADGESTRVDETWYCCNVPSPKTGDCAIGNKTFTFAQTTESRPLMQSIMRSRDGVYGCDEDGCTKAWRRFILDTPNICKDPLNDSSSKNDTLCGQIGSLWIHGDFVAVLYEKEDYKGKKICFDNRKATLQGAWEEDGLLINRLDDCDINNLGVACVVGANHTNGWNEDADSIKILEGWNTEIIDSICPEFEKTL